MLKNTWMKYMKILYMQVFPPCTVTVLLMRNELNITGFKLVEHFGWTYSNRDIMDSRMVTLNFLIIITHCCIFMFSGQKLREIIDELR